MPVRSLAFAATAALLVAAAASSASAEVKLVQSTPAANAAAGLVEDAAAAARVEQIKADTPDLMVQIDGMEKPMRLADVLAAVKAEADDMKLDGDLMQAAAECALLQGA